MVCCTCGEIAEVIMGGFSFCKAHGRRFWQIDKAKNVPTYGERIAREVLDEYRKELKEKKE